MNALDTNVLARFFIDDPDDAQTAKQRPAAVAALSQRAFVSITVVLELEWVMRGFYKMPKPQIERVLRTLAGIEHVTLENRSAVLAALDAFGAGLDFADALHLASSARAAAFLTFDHRLAKRGTGLALEPRVRLLGSEHEQTTQKSARDPKGRKRRIGGDVNLPCYQKTVDPASQETSAVNTLTVSA